MVAMRIAIIVIVNIREKSIVMLYAPLKMINRNHTGIPKISQIYFIYFINIPDI